MKPVISFFDGQKYIYSTDYKVLLCGLNVPVEKFLSDLENRFPSEMKILQINFDAFSEPAQNTTQLELYASAKAAVFVLNNFDVLTIEQINLKHQVTSSSQPEFKLLCSKNQFMEKVIAIKSMISEGRFYQVNLTYALKAELAEEPLNFFLRRYDSYRGKYKAFLPFDSHAIVSFSPELFIEKKSARLITRPIKGSLPANGHSQNELIKNEKEAAELSMIVDLLRNDLNSLETKNSAIVTKHRELMNLNYIQHTFSEIGIETEKPLSFILRNMMPGGSISGCPKKESLLAITELEPTKRSAYTGAIGWWQKNDFSLNIAIRTFVQSQQNYFYFAGCGIVYDSDPEKEFSELINKTGQLNVSYE